MKRKLAIICSALALGAFAQSALAADSGTISFEGGVTETTCNVKVNGQSSDAKVKLPIVSKKLLDASGKTAGRTFLTFELTGCAVASDAAPGTKAATQVSVFFTAGPNINTAGRLDNKALTGPATKVDLQFLNIDGTTVMDLSKGIAATGVTGQGATLTPIDSSGGAVIRHYVQYYATAPATAGKVESSVEYEINYE